MLGVSCVTLIHCYMVKQRYYVQFMSKSNVMALNEKKSYSQAGMWTFQKSIVRNIFRP